MNPVPLTDFFSQLKKLVDIKNIQILPIKITIVQNSNNRIQALKTKGENWAYNEDLKELFIEFHKLDAQKKNELGNLLPEAIRSGSADVFEENASNLLNRIYDYEKTAPDKDILRFFEKIVPKEDYEALESALFLRTAFKNYEDVSQLKRDISVRFGLRGRNISNLCTAGYFEKFFMPLYNQVNHERFGELYELIIRTSSVAVFVHSEKSEKQIFAEIEQKLAISRKYGLEFIHVHAIGNMNVQKVLALLKHKDDYFKDAFHKKIMERDGVLIVEFILKTQKET